MSKRADVCVIGGGAAGIVAAISAKRAGAGVLLLERSGRVGKKILATGNGRCNITNAYIAYDNYHGDSAFAADVLGRFSFGETIDFFESMGLVCCEGEEGKMYPGSLQATSVLDLLRAEMERLSVEIETDFHVKSIVKEKNQFKISSGESEVFAHKVILCPGGFAAPEFGTDGNGARLAKSLSHTVSKTYPALVQLKCENAPKALKGVKHFCTATLYVDGKKQNSRYGEVLFTEYGLSGPPIFNLSREASVAVSENKNTEISLELLPESFGEICTMLERRKKNLPHLNGENFLNSIINKRIGFEIVKKSSNIKEMASLLKNYRYKVVGTMGFKNAQVTAGGVLCSEVYSDTLMSKKVPGLYFAGEILDVDGDCGGFNLQFAWSSGAIAGKSAAER